MQQVNMHEAKTNFSRLVESLENGTEDAIVIARNGKPVARLVRENALEATGRRIGVARGKFVVPPPSRNLEDEITELFESGG
jgi:antitoxin (DNA-binding transcriptional repressor) of toxin-antitoxin stability system